MTKIMPIGGPIRPIDFSQFEQTDFVVLGRILVFTLFPYYNGAGEIQW